MRVEFESCLERDRLMLLDFSDGEWHTGPVPAPGPGESARLRLRRDILICDVYLPAEGDGGGVEDSHRARYGDGLLGGVSDTEESRLAAMAAVCDPATVRTFDDLGVAAGWRCLEIGAGGGSIATWLADRVAGSDRAGPGEVVATDIDVHLLARIAGPRLSVLAHDITCDPPPAGGPFDLIHARFVLEHLREREHVLDCLSTWLRPAGTIVIESIAAFPLASSSHPAFRDTMISIERALATTIGTDSTWARSFPRPLLTRGFRDVGSTVHLPVTGGGNASALCWALTLSRMRSRILELGLASAETLDRAAVHLADPTFFDLAFATAVAWGRTP